MNYEIDAFDARQADGCSVPVLRWLCPSLVNGWWRTACVVHDEAYWYGGPACARLEADQSLLVGIIEQSRGRHLLLGVLVACLYYVAVRAGGHPGWSRLWPRQLGHRWLWAFGLKRALLRRGQVWVNAYTRRPATARRDARSAAA